VPCRDELRALFTVDPKVDCDTHNAIKCKCMAGTGGGSGCGTDDSSSEEGGSGEAAVSLLAFRRGVPACRSTPRACMQEHTAALVVRDGAGLS
jgi:hypothetical protein